VRIFARAALWLAIVSSVSAGAPTIAAADEGGVSFWLPGPFGSLAAVPQQPGWSLATIYFHDSVTAGANVGRAREFTIGNIPINASANLSARLNSNIDLALVVPTYTFANSFFGPGGAQPDGDIWRREHVLGGNSLWHIGDAFWCGFVFALPDH
jgi:hypothetical protein